MIRFVISWVLKVEGMLMLLPALVGAMYQEKTGFAYLIWGLLCIAVRSDPLLQKTVQYGNLFPRRICLRFVKLGCPWCFRAVPFVITGEIPFYINALFEIVSGFTNDRSQHFERCGSPFTRQPVLEKLFPLDWRYGRSCVHSCIASDEGRFRHEPDEGRKPGTDCFQICSESARNR